MKIQAGKRILSIDWDFLYYRQRLPKKDYLDEVDKRSPNYSKRLRDFIDRYHAGADFDFYKDQDWEPSEFWNKIIRNTPEAVVVSPDHSDIIRCIPQGASVVNFDAHHDLGYDPDVVNYCCANWAYWLLQWKMLAKYQVVFPRWRREYPDKAEKSYHYTIDRAKIDLSSIDYWDGTQVFDTVFITSSPEYSTYYDTDLFKRFVSYWGTPYLEIQSAMTCGGERVY